MTTQQITFLLPPYGSATLTLPELLTPAVFACLDLAIGNALRESCPSGITDAANNPGAIEVDSWLIELH